MAAVCSLALEWKAAPMGTRIVQFADEMGLTVQEVRGPGLSGKGKYDVVLRKWGIRARSVSFLARLNAHGRSSGGVVNCLACFSDKRNPCNRGT